MENVESSAQIPIGENEVSGAELAEQAVSSTNMAIREVSVFCFTDAEYFVESTREFEHNCFAVRMSSGDRPFEHSKVLTLHVSKLISETHGTTVFVNDLKYIGITEERIKSEIGLRFLTDLDFLVKLNGKSN